MSRDPEATRTAILDAAEGLVLDRGLSGTSVGTISARAGVTKGAFYHHFDTKADLAHALMERFAAADLDQLEDNLDRAERLSRDPLQHLLILVGLYQEKMEQLTEPYPGCLFASYLHEAELLETETLAVPRHVMRTWRGRLVHKLRAAAEAHPPVREVDLESLADMMTVVFEGAFVVSKTLRDPEVVARQLGHYRTYLKLLFSPPSPGPGTEANDEGSGRDPS